jgi:hypothetical protein
MHVIQGSDAHRLDRDPTRESNLGVGDRPTEVLLPEVSFEALKQLFTSQEFDRTRPFTPPPDDPVKAARLEGNTAHQSFHENAASKRGHTAILRDVVAFANSAGGRIYVGVSSAEKRPVAGVGDPKPLIAELTGEIAEQITPPVSVAFEETESDGKAVLVLDVAEGTHKPHAIAPGGIFVRRNTGSAQATRDEIVHMVTSGPVSAAPAARPVATTPYANGHAIPEPTPAVSPAPGRAPKSTASRGRGQAARSRAAVPSEQRKSSANGAAGAAAPTATSDDVLEMYEEPAAPDPIAPTTGVEVVGAFEQDGVRYYTLRDLRYNKLIHHVTKETDRRLWRSAIAQREKGDLDESTVRWDGDFGLWRSYRQRSGDRHYDLVYRGDGDPRIFFGVSEGGMNGRWKTLLPAKKATA